MDRQRLKEKLQHVFMSWNYWELLKRMNDGGGVHDKLDQLPLTYSSVEVRGTAQGELGAITKYWQHVRCVVESSPPLVSCKKGLSIRCCSHTATPIGRIILRTLSHSCWKSVQHYCCAAMTRESSRCHTRRLSPTSSRHACASLPAASLESCMHASLLACITAATQHACQQTGRGDIIMHAHALHAGGRLHGSAAHLQVRRCRHLQGQRCHPAVQG